MIELSYIIVDKKSGEYVLRDYGIFESLNEFYAYMQFRYNYTSYNYDFILSGRKIEK